MKKLIEIFANYSVNFPLRVLSLYTVAIIISIYFALKIEIRTSNLDLIDSNLPVIKNFVHFAESFGNPNTLLVVFEGENETSLSLITQSVSAQLELIPEIHRVISRIPLDPLAFINNDRSTFYTTSTGSAYFLFVQPKDTRTQVSAIAPLINKVREITEKNLPAFPDVKVGYTGIPQYALDDQSIIQKDLSFLSIISLIIILLLFIFFFREIKGPFLATISLLIGVVLTLGIISKIPGHLTLLSAPFAMMLFGLGIDYAVHILAHLEITRNKLPYKESIVNTISELSRSLLSACSTTIVVFLILLVSGFKGFRELGLIASFGMALCCFSMFTALPALLSLFEIRSNNTHHELAKNMSAWASNKYLAASLIIISLSTFLFPSPKFDSNYLNLQPINSNTVRLERLITEQSSYSPYFAAFIVDDIKQAYDLTARLKKDKNVGEVRSISELGTFGTENLPENLIQMFKSKEGKFAVYAFPNQSIWNTEYETKFLESMKQIDQNVTGLPIIGNAMINKTKNALKITEDLALILVTLIVFFDFRKISTTLFVMFSPISSMLLMQVLMNLLDISYNPINIMALPIILGIAVDYSIYVTHRFIQENGDLKKMFSGTGKSILLTTLTTLAAFGTLCFTSHLGLRSFGIILSFGITAGFILSVTILPWLLVKFSSKVLN